MVRILCVGATPGVRPDPFDAYQAWSAPQCGQATVVETDAANTNPQAHV